MKCQWNHCFQFSERILFYGLLATHVSLLLAFPYFLTVDGPSHLYNAGCLKELFAHNQSFLAQFYEIQGILLPNSLGHLLLTVLLTLVKPLIAEKIVLLLIVVLLPLGFRMFLHEVSKENLWLSLFIFPFTYSFLLLYGFYNFILAVIVLFFTLWFFFKRFTLSPSFVHYVFLALFGFTLYLSHIFVFACFLLFLAVYFFIELLRKFKKREKIWTDLRKWIFVLLSLSPGLILLFIFLSQGATDGALYYFLPFTQKLSWLFGVQPVKAMNYGREAVFSVWLLYIIVLMILYIIVWRVLNKERFTNTYLPLYLFYTSLLLLLFFILPDGNEQAGFISSRLLFLFFLFLVLFLSMFRYHVFIKILSVFIITYVSISILLIYRTSLKQIQPVCHSVIEAGNLLESDATLIGIIDSDFFLYRHIDCYAAARKKVAILTNYEAELAYFPIRWKHSLPQYTLGALLPSSGCVNWLQKSSAQQQMATYILLIKGVNGFYSKGCMDVVEKQLALFYNRIYFNEETGVMVYQLIQ